MQGASQVRGRVLAEVAHVEQEGPLRFFPFLEQPLQLRDRN
jgi:hypothetical protein